MGEKEKCLPYRCDLSDMYSYRFGRIINRFPDIVSDPEWELVLVDISGSSDGSPLSTNPVPYIEQVGSFGQSQNVTDRIMATTANRDRP